MKKNLQLVCIGVLMLCFIPQQSFAQEKKIVKGIVLSLIHIYGLNVSRTQLYRKMKSITDMPISTLIRNYRIEKAYELLKENDYTISEVMYQVGISSNSYFTKIFKEYYNIAPSAFVKQSHNK